MVSLAFVKICPNGCLGRSILWKVDGHIVTSWSNKNHEQSCGVKMLAPKKKVQIHNVAWKSLKSPPPLDSKPRKQ